jgi:hypothetical protein
VSHFTTIKTKITDTKSLITALEELGFKQVETYETAQPLYGYQGDIRTQTAEVIIRRHFVGRASNDIGFKRQADGAFIAVISQFDRHTYSDAWLSRLTQRYAYHATRAKLQEEGFALVSEQHTEDGRIHLVLRRAT